MKKTTRFLSALLALGLLPALTPASTPIATVHPGWTLTNLRPVPGFRPMVGGMGFLSDGRLVLGHWGGTRDACCPNGNYGGRQYTGKIYVLSGVTGDNPVVTVDTIATGLEDIMGLAVVRDTIYVSGGNRILRLVRNGNTGPITRIDTVFILPGTPMTLGSALQQTTDPAKVNDSLWPVKGRSEWLYGMIVRNDTFFVAPSSMYSGSGITQVNPYRGTVIAVTLGNGTTNKRGSFKILAMGFRHQPGLAFGPDSSIWTTETQGPWLPTNKLIAVKRGAFYGHKHTPSETWDNMPETPAAVFLPQGTVSNGGSTGGNGNRDAAGVFANSPSQPFYMTSGPYAGQMLLGDMSYGGIQRYFIEKVNGEWQGAGFNWMGGLESAAYRIEQGPDGQLYLGMLGASNDWSWNGQFYGLQKLKYTGPLSFEMLAVRSRAQGMEIEFTQPVDTALAKDTSRYVFTTYYYTPTLAYGGTQTGNTILAKGAIQISADRMKVFVPLTGLVARTGSEHRIVEINLKNTLRSASGDTLWNGKAYYTLNAISPTAPFIGTAIADSRVARSRAREGLRWTVQAGEMSVESAFQGAYALRLVDVRGEVLARASGSGVGIRSLPVRGLRGKVAVLVATGDGITLRRIVLLP